MITILYLDQQRRHLKKHQELWKQMVTALASFSLGCNSIGGFWKGEKKTKAEFGGVYFDLQEEVETQSGCGALYFDLMEGGGEGGTSDCTFSAICFFSWEEFSVTRSVLFLSSTGLAGGGSHPRAEQLLEQGRQHLQAIC